MKCNLFPFFCYSLWDGGGGGDFGSGSGSKFNCAARVGSGRVGSGQTISGTGRVRASVLSPCRPLEVLHGVCQRKSDLWPELEWAMVGRWYLKIGLPLCLEDLMLFCSKKGLFNHMF